MAKSTFNMSRCGSSGGIGGNSQPCSGWAEIRSANGDDITVVSKDKLKEALREIYAEEPALTKTISDRVKLFYDCPKEGDAVFWNPMKGSSGGYDIAAAELNIANPSDTEQLIESLGIVEKVHSANCEDGMLVDTDGYEATVVFFGHITFSTQSQELIPGSVYYLADNSTNVPFNKKLGNNAVHGEYEPVISKPVFVSTGVHTAMVTNYRPLTGSPTGGVQQREEYAVEIIPNSYNDSAGNFSHTGWEVTVKNVGDVASRNALFLQLEYNKLEGPQTTGTNFRINPLQPDTYYHFEDIGILYTANQAAIRGEDATIKDEITFKVVPSFAGGPSYVTGIGELRARLKVFTQSTANISSSERLSSPEILLTNESDVMVSKIAPTLSFAGECSDNLTNTNDVFYDEDGLVDPTQVLYEEGTVFEIKLENSICNTVGAFPQLDENGQTIDRSVVSMKVPMTSSIGFMVEALIETNNTFEVDNTFNVIDGAFKLPPVIPETGEYNSVLEIIPINSSGDTIIERHLRIKAVDADTTELPSDHWASQYAASQSQIYCTGKECCNPTFEVLIPADTNSIIVPITNILTDGDCEVFGGSNADVTNAVFYTKPAGADSITPRNRDSIYLSFKNMRENTQFCYPSVAFGVKPSFMTIYDKKARVIEDINDHTITGNQPEQYDPRYTLTEIGAQDTLDGEEVRFTINLGSTEAGAPETCYTFNFDGSMQGKHFTLEEIEKLQGSNFSVRTISTS